MDVQLQALIFMADQERERVKKAEKKQLQRARELRGVALTSDQGSALRDQDKGSSTGSK